MSLYEKGGFIIALALAFLIGLVMGNGTLGLALTVGIGTYIGIRLLEYM